MIGCSTLTRLLTCTDFYKAVGGEIRGIICALSCLSNDTNQRIPARCRSSRHCDSACTEGRGVKGVRVCVCPYSRVCIWGVYMSVCACVYVFLCVYVCARLCVFLCMFICLCASVYVGVCVSECVCVYACASVCISVWSGTSPVISLK